MFDDYDYQQDEINELRAQARFERRLRNKLMRHPDPRDPDYPFDDDDADCGTEDDDIEEAEGHDYNG